MKKTTLTILTGLALFTSACGAVQATQTPTQNPPAAEDTSGISVTGTGEVLGTPDVATVSFGVSVVADTVADATNRAAERAQALIDSLTGAGVAREDITTTGFSIFPEYDWRNDGRVLLGYRVSNTVQAKIRNVFESGEVIDAAVAAAGDDVTVNGISFELEDSSELTESAREAAWEDALAKATQLAELAGRRLGPAVSITETVTGSPVPIFTDTAALAEEAFATPIEPGRTTVTITLDVKFAFGD